MNQAILNLLNQAEMLAANDSTIDPNIHACIQMTRIDCEHWMLRTFQSTESMELSRA